MTTGISRHVTRSPGKYTLTVSNRSHISLHFVPSYNAFMGTHPRYHYMCLTMQPFIKVSDLLKSLIDLHRRRAKPSSKQASQSSRHLSFKSISVPHLARPHHNAIEHISGFICRGTGHVLAVAAWPWHFLRDTNTADRS